MATVRPPEDPESRSQTGGFGNTTQRTRADNEEFRRLFDEYSGGVFSFFVNRGFSREECRDLTQETFLRVFTSIDTFRGDSSFGTWLYSITTNVWRGVIRERGRKKRKGEELSFEELAETGTAPHSATISAVGAEDGEPLLRLLDDELSRLVRDALDELPELMRYCTLLRLDQGLKYREIAVVLKISIETVKSQLFQARAKLRNRLAPHFQD